MVNGALKPEQTSILIVILSIQGGLFFFKDELNGIQWLEMSEFHGQPYFNFRCRVTMGEIKVNYYLKK